MSLIVTLKTADTASSTIISKRTNSAAGSAGYLLGIDYGGGDGKPYFEISDGVREFSMRASESISDNEWHTVIVVVDKDLQAGNKIYIDGQDRTSTRTGTVTGVYDTTNAIALNIGRNNDNSGRLTGAIDRVAILHYALTRADMNRENAGGFDVNVGAPEMNPATNAAWDPFGGAAPVAWWKFDEMSGTTVKDYASSSLNGTWNGTGGHFKKGKKGMSGNFNGVDDWVSSINIGHSNMVTVSAWIKRGTGGGSMIVSKTQTNYEWELTYGSNGYLYFNVNGNAAGGCYRALDNKWHFITGRYDKNNIELYFDNAICGTSIALTEDILNYNNSVGIGRRFSGSTSCFPGQIDDVRIYSCANCLGL
jgi:hypothetical protein